jgi:hypothetical protein
MTTKSITVKDTFFGGHLVLQPGRPIEDCYFELHNHSSSLHLGMEFNRKIITVLSALNLECEIFFGLISMKLRGIAKPSCILKKGWARN